MDEGDAPGPDQTPEAEVVEDETPVDIDETGRSPGPQEAEEVIAVAEDHADNDAAQDAMDIDQEVENSGSSTAIEKSEGGQRDDEKPDTGDVSQQQTGPSQIDGSEEIAQKEEAEHEPSAKAETPSVTEKEGDENIAKDDIPSQGAISSMESKQDVPPAQEAMDESSSKGDTPSVINPLAGPTAKLNLDEETLSTLSDYLKSKEYAHTDLDDEKVMELTHSIHRDATERTRHRKNLTENFQAVGDRDETYDRMYKEEEKFSLASAFFKKLVDEASAATDDVDMDPRTLSWVKKAAGLQRPDDPLDKSNDYFSDSEEEAEAATSRRMTRGVRKERRRERIRKENETLSIFVDAIKEIEKERKTSFGTASQQSSEEYEALSTSDASEESSTDPFITSFGSSTRDYPPESELIATSADGSDIAVRLMFRGRIISGAGYEELKDWHMERKRAREKDRLVSTKRSKKSEQVDTTGQAQVSGQVPSTSEGQNKNGSSLQKGYVEYYLPDVDQSVASSKLPGQTRRVGAMRPYPQGSICSRFYKFLGGRARRWVRHEFFYPDLDAAWYEFDTRVAKIASWVPPNVKLTWREWKTIRRQFKRPVRFSKAFIAKEVTKRNHFRQLVRNFQHNPAASNPYGFPVPPIIKPGTSVDAYNKRYHIIHRGTVLFYSRGDGGYFVQFDAEELGCEFCPDTEVACVSPPTLLPTNKKGETPANGKPVARILKPDPPDEEGVRRISENDGAFERRSLVSLIANVERAIKRKNAILDAIEEQNNFVSPYNRSQHRHFEASSLNANEGLQQTIAAWLHANLILTNRSLRETMEHLNSTYAGCAEAKTGESAPPAAMPGDDDDDGGFDDELFSKMAKRLARSLGYKEASPQFLASTKKLMKMEMRKALALPSR